LAPQSVLCVDDYPAGLDTMRKVLEHAGFTVVTSSESSSAPSLAAKTKFDAAVLDFHMPQTDGVSLARLLKQQQPDLPILLISAYPADIPEDAVKSVDCFLCKGHDTARELPAAVKRLVGSKVRSKAATVDQLRSATREALEIDEKFALRLQREK
jgi:CheY-like chemotaxis protein